MFELDILPVTDQDQEPQRLIIYRPRARLAFVGNRAMSELAVAASQGKRRPRAAGAADAFLERIGFFEPDPSPPGAPIEAFRPAGAADDKQVSAPGAPTAMRQQVRQAGRYLTPTSDVQPSTMCAGQRPRTAATSLRCPSMVAASQPVRGHR